MNKPKNNLQTLNKSKKLTATPVGETGCLCIAFFTCPIPFSIIPHSSMYYRQVFRPISYFQPSPSQSDSRLYPAQPFWMHRHPIFQFTYMWLTGYHAMPEVTCTHSHVAYRTPCHAKGHLTLIPGEAKDFRIGDRHFKCVPPPTYLICLSPKGLYW